MKVTACAALVLILALSGMACAKKNSVNLSDYFPVKLGARWVFSGEGNEYAPFTRQVTYSQGNRAQMEDDNGGTVMAIVYTVTETEVKRVFRQGEAYEKKSLLAEKENVSEVLIKTPLLKGQTWDSGQSTVLLEATDAAVEVPAGKFTGCLMLKISSKASAWVIYEWYAPGVGLVKRQSGDGQAKVTSSLKSYTIPK
jgi:hypothetical protein